ncbi:hypothetical protein Kfla_0639 [Kribbella flavida DSM 17836]|uniref:Uncharacterized protein n=1 Tax=Kribbella flavida (strain DSM 17836 / JCM 10339 / NBRC 14399) TaxID=479435 RepID=D2PXB2_KRIFD|nr:hypothetical protein [Kribbella flavida]ADB29760.1 hypothetical protein Kfla_0639 [Kribbella flavida DSM 17836]
MEFHAAALAQLDGLPAEAFDALVRRATELVVAPWDSMALGAGEPAFRQTTFHPLGLLSFYVDDSRQLLRIFDVTWVG